MALIFILFFGSSCRIVSLYNKIQDRSKFIFFYMIGYFFIDFLIFQDVQVVIEKVFIMDRNLLGKIGFFWGQVSRWLILCQNRSCGVEIVGRFFSGQRKQWGSRGDDKVLFLVNIFFQVYSICEILLLEIFCFCFLGEDSKLYTELLISQWGFVYQVIFFGSRVGGSRSFQVFKQIFLLVTCFEFY